MHESSQRGRSKAVFMLLSVCVLWGATFPLMKAVSLRAQTTRELSTWFVASSALSLRFTVAALLLVCFGQRSATSKELIQGVGLGVFTAVGLLFQMDGLNFTEASTSAFLTQAYVVIIPIGSALAARRLPSFRLSVAVLTMLVGMGVLSRFDWQQLRLGRGESETLLAASLFSVQILWLGKKSFVQNRALAVSLVSFTTMALVLLPVACLSAHDISDVYVAFGSLEALTLLGVLALPCTLLAYHLMNRYQPQVDASEAGIVYGAEPLFASFFALFLPALLARFCGIDYPNETLTSRLLVGGALIVLANVILQLPNVRRAQASPHVP
jgi:drug/metabolite transporter (DMT)-like permease